MLLCLLLKPRLPKGLNQQPDNVNRDDIGNRDDIADDSDDDDEEEEDDDEDDDYEALIE